MMHLKIVKVRKPVSSKIKSLFLKLGYNIIHFPQDSLSTEVLIIPLPDQEGNKLMFLSEWRGFPSSPCLAGKET
jgi:hypothetical protein